MCFLQLAIFAYVYSARKVIIFHFNFWLSFQRPLSSFTGINANYGNVAAESIP